MPRGTVYGIHIDGGPGFDGLGALADYLLIEKELRRAAGHLRTYVVLVLMSSVN